MAYETYRSELVICDDVVVELEDLSGLDGDCTSICSMWKVDRDGWFVVLCCTSTNVEEGWMILCPCKAWINSRESSSVFVGDESWKLDASFDEIFSISVISEFYKQTNKI